MEQGLCHGLLGHALVRNSVMRVGSRRCCGGWARQKAAMRCRLLATMHHARGECLDLMLIGSAAGN
jgi:hypothetical protein